MPSDAPRIDIPFDAQEERIGRDIFDGGGVEDLAADPSGRIEARVRHGRRTLLVTIIPRREQSALAACDCPHMDETGRGCEHLRAVLLALAAERAGDDGDTPRGLHPRFVIDLEATVRDRRLLVDIRDDDLRPLPMTTETWRRIQDAAPLRACHALAEAAGVWRRGGGFVVPRGPWAALPEANLSFLTRDLCATARLHLSPRPSAPPRLMVGGEELAFRLRIRPLPGDQVEIRGELEGAAPPGAGCDRILLPLTPTPLLILGDRIHVVRHDGAIAWLEETATSSPRILSIAAFDRRTAGDEPTAILPRIILGDAPEPLPLRREPPRPRGRIDRMGDQAILALEFLYGDAPPLRPSSQNRHPFDRQLGCQYARDAVAEAAALRAALEAGFEPAGDPDRLGLDAALLPAAARSLLDAGFLLRLDGRDVRQARAMPLRIRAGADWFEISGGPSATDPAASLAAVLAACRRGARFVDVGRDECLLLGPEAARLRGLAALLPSGSESGGALRFEGAAGLLLAAAAEDLGAEVDPAFEAYRAGLRDVETPRPTATPPGFAGELRPYQREGAAWLRFLADAGLSGCLADEMGLGKTVQVLAHIADWNVRGAAAPHLLIVPRSLVHNWIAEAARFVPGVSIRPWDRGASTAPTPGTVLVTTFGILRRDVERLAALRFDLIVLDEAQALKNRDSLTAGAARRLRGRMRVALTGTPVENAPEELASLLEILNPALFGEGRATTLLRAAEQDDGALRLLHRALRPLLLRRTKEQVLPDLPPLIEQTIACDMSEEQERLHASLLDAARASLRSGGEAARNPVLILETLLRLRQVACHPALVPGHEGESSGKLDVLLDRLDECRLSGRKALVFSQFTSFLALVKDALLARGIEPAELHGEVRDRAAPVRRFQTDPRCTVLLASLRVGGVGLNLTAADTVFLLDPWWNPAVEAQAVARAHRMGRERPVTLLRLLSRGTVEERMIALLDSKQALADRLLAGASPSASGLTAADLRALIE